MVGTARTRALIAVALCTSLAAPAAGTAAAKSRAAAKLLSPAVIQGGDIAIRDSVASRPATFAHWGGAVVARTGDTVKVYASAAYANDPTVTQRAADFVASLYHGPELEQATFYLAPPSEIQQLCGGGDAACYLPGPHELVVPGQDLPDGTSVETILAHEYGHFIAQSRSNAPWAALDYGPKRWASVENVCARTKTGAAFPGNEDAGYARNPGEAWAETYRLLNYEHLARPDWSPAPWILDDSFKPGADALEAARRDVLDPWQGPTTAEWSGSLAAAAPFRPPLTRTARRRHVRAPVAVDPLATHTIKTLNDGVLTVSLDSAPAGATVSLTDATGKPLAGGAGSVDFTLCGQRSVTLTVSAPHAGAVLATLSIP